MKLQRSIFMEGSFSYEISFMRLFCGFKNTEIFAHRVEAYLRNIFRSQFSDAEKTCGNIVTPSFFEILRLRSLRYISQINEPIVTAITVNMINSVFRIFSGNVEPCKSVSEMVYPQQHYLPISIRPNTSSYFSNLYSIASLNSTQEYSCFRIIGKFFLQSFKSKILFSHDAVTSLIGERPARDYSRCGLRYSSTHLR
jgi:hypothetical protein